MIALSTDAELAEAVRVMESLNPNSILRFHVCLEDDDNNDTESDSKPKPVHENVTCDGCGLFPMVMIMHIYYKPLEGSLPIFHLLTGRNPLQMYRPGQL